MPRYFVPPSGRLRCYLEPTRHGCAAGVASTSETLTRIARQLASPGPVGSHRQSGGSHDSSQAAKQVTGKGTLAGSGDSVLALMPSAFTQL